MKGSVVKYFQSQTVTFMKVCARMTKKGMAGVVRFTVMETIILAIGKMTRRMAGVKSSI